jgi:hypothetical protein
MKMTVKFYEYPEPFSTYKEACLWVGQNIVKHEVEIGETLWKITKVNEGDYPTFRLELYCTIDASETCKNFCDHCKEFHSAFFLNQQYNCDACNYTAFKKQMEQKLKIKKDYRVEKLGYMLEE